MALAALDRPGDVPAVYSRLPEWINKVAVAVNWLLRRQYPFEPLSAAPANPIAGRSYYDTTTNKVRTYDGTAWRDHW